jgi:hypothetical protein
MHFFKKLHEFRGSQGAPMMMLPLIIMEMSIVPLLTPLLGSDKQSEVISALWVGPFDEVYRDQ